MRKKLKREKKVIKMGNIPKETGEEGTQSPGPGLASVTASGVIRVKVEIERALKAKERERGQERPSNICL